ncbi:NAD(P)H-dependent oxidoreductase [Hoeflea sp. CAU 1731]
MNALVVYCHPHEGSFTSAVRDVVTGHLRTIGAELRVIDLYGEDFQPVLSESEWSSYEATQGRSEDIARHAEALAWCDTLIFVYPTWWYGHPAMLKGWMERILLPGVAFEMPDGGDIKPLLRNVRRLGVYTTCGASWWLTFIIGAPGRKTILRGIGLLCHPRACKSFAAHYSMDRSTSESRARHLEKVEKAIAKLTANRRGQA